jgi:hypothetical protein
MVATQIAARGVADPVVLAALRTVPRERGARLVVILEVRRDAPGLRKMACLLLLYGLEIGDE